MDVTPDPRNAAVGLVTLSFSESVTGLDIGDLSLTRDGNPVTLTAGRCSWEVEAATRWIWRR